MTNEEIQRVVEFISKQQESFAEGMEQMRQETRQRQAQAEERISEFGRATVHLYNTTTELAKSHIVLNEKLAVLAEAQRQLTESLAHTDRRVNVLIDILEQRRNGKDKE